MKKLFLLIGLVVFLTPSLVNANEDEEEQKKINQKLIEEQEEILGRKLDQSEKSCVFFGYKPSECLRGSSANIFVQNKERWKAYYRDLKNNPPKACLSNDDIDSINKKCKVALNISEERKKYNCQYLQNFNPDFPSFPIQEDNLSYQCKKIYTKERCLGLVTRKMENKKNCKQERGFKKLTQKDFGIGKKISKKI